MIFIIWYHRRRGQILAMIPFPDDERDAAADLRLKLELALHRDGVLFGWDSNHEVVTLQAENEAAIRLTHGRYFYGRGESK